MPQAPTDVPNKAKMSQQGAGANKRDSAVATDVSRGGKTVKLRSGQVTRSAGPALRAKK